MIPTLSGVAGEIPKELTEITSRIKVRNAKIRATRAVIFALLRIVPGPDSPFRGSRNFCSAAICKGQELEV